MNSDAGAMRSSSHTGLRPMGAPTRTTVGGEVVVNMMRGQVPEMDAVTSRICSDEAVVLDVREAVRVVVVGSIVVRSTEQLLQLGGTR